MLLRKSQLQGDNGKPQAANWASLERARLTQARLLAVRRNDKAEVAILDAQLADLAVDSPPVATEPTEDASALLAKVNERNRKANLEAIRRAELQEVERKRRERRLGTPTTLDPSARLRTVPRMFTSRYVPPSLQSFLVALKSVAENFFLCYLPCPGLQRQIPVRPHQTLCLRTTPPGRAAWPRQARPRLVLMGRAISTRVFSRISILIWATFKP